MITENVAGQLGSVQKGLKANPDIKQYLGDPTVEFRDKSRRVLDFLPSGASPETGKFIQYLLSEGAIDQLDQIVAEVNQLARGGPRTTEAVVTSAVPLTAREQADLKLKLMEQAGGDLDLSYVVDPDLIGGLVVRVGDRVIDSSVASRLRQLRESILKAL